MEEATDSIIQPLPSERKQIEAGGDDFMSMLPITKKRIEPMTALNTALHTVDSTGQWKEDGPLKAQHHAAFQRADLLRRASLKHSWTRATVMTVARSAIGSGFTITRHPVYGKVTVESKIQNPTEVEELKPVYDFFYGVEDDEVEYIQDLNTNATKIMYTITSLVLYGQAAWAIKYDDNGQPIDFDVLPGYVFPNVDENGKFLKPAYYFRPWNSSNTTEFKKPKDIVYITWPGTDLSIFGASEYAAAAESSIPSDLYASAVYRSHFENINAPFNGFWVVDPTTSDEDFRKFMAMVFNRYTGVRNFGRNPIVVRGDAEFRELRSRSNDDAPYLEGRKYNQEEISAVSGVSSSKLGLGSNVNRTNFREQRRDFWETTLRPLYAIVEEAIYRQVFVRLFNLREWHLSFNRPDLTTALEQATIDTRYLQNGVLNPNEARANINLPPREDELGFQFFDPLAIQLQRGKEQQIGDTQDNPRINDRASENESDRSGDMQRPPTSDRPQNEEPGPNKSVSQEVLDELRTWKKFAIKSAEGKRAYRPFETHYIEPTVSNGIEDFIIDNLNDKETIRNMFDKMIEILQ